jgi:DNA-binding response OmpR family regulator
MVKGNFCLYKKFYLKKKKIITGIAMMKEKKYDLVLIDINMPIKDGL